MLEVTNSVNLEYPGLISKEIITPQWRSAMDAAEKFELARFESARLHSEILALTESIKPDGDLIKDKITIQRALQVGGMYRCDLVDESKRLVIDINTLARPTTLAMKHRHLAGEGYAVVGLNYWEIRKFKNFDEQQMFLHEKIKRAVRKTYSS